ncbi:MAG: hypothetical protein AB1679_21800 [Actinomycetota bacterium]|jgi:DNA-directed RNA polymerase specialized sigma24 family protein
MASHLDDPTTADDLTLVDAARAGDRLAFGVLYLRHNAAAWRVACVVSRFSPDAELAVIQGFTRVFSALPENCEALTPASVRFRPYLLACVRQVALDRARDAGRAHGSPAPLAGLAPDGELVLSSLEHHVVRAGLAALSEPTRTALWLSEVEAMTPSEIAALMGGQPDEMAALVGQARKDVDAASHAALSSHEVRADCRFTVANLDAFQAATLDPAKGVLVRSHLDICPTCRMRRGELANGPATLAAAVPAAPLLGGEAQHHSLTNAPALRPAPHLLPPGLAAAVPADLPRPARRLTVAAAGVPGAARQAGRTIRPALPALSLVVAWLGVMLSLPQLMRPDTAPGPDGLALPAVQAYVPDYVPRTGSTRPAGTPAAGPQPPANGAGAAAGAEPPPRPDADEAAAGTAAAARPAVKFTATTVRPRRITPSTPRPSPPPVVSAATPTATVAAAPPPAATPIPTSTVTPVASPARTTNGETRRSDIASLRSKAREEFDGRVARQPAGRRHTDHAQSA